MPSAPCFPCRPFSTASPDMTHPHCIGIHAHVFFFLENIVFSICSYITNEKMVGERQPQRARPSTPISPFCHVSLLLLVHGHVRAIRDNTERLARRALHQKRIPAPLGLQPRLRHRHDRRGNLEQGERVAAICAQRTVQCNIPYHSACHRLPPTVSHLRMRSRHPLQGWHLHLHLLAVT